MLFIQRGKNFWPGGENLKENLYEMADDIADDLTEATLCLKK